jgi:hypothetical protein
MKKSIVLLIILMLVLVMCSTAAAKFGYINGRVNPSAKPSKTGNFLIYKDITFTINSGSIRIPGEGTVTEGTIHIKLLIGSYSYAPGMGHNSLKINGFGIV